MPGRGRPPKKGPMSEYMLKKHGLWVEPEPEEERYDEDGNLLPPKGKGRPKLTEEEKEERRRRREEERRLHPERFRPRHVNPDLVVHTSRRQQLLLEQQKEREEKERKEQEIRDGINAGTLSEEEEEERPVPMTEKEVEEEKVFGTVTASSVAKKETKKPNYYNEELEKGIGEDLLKMKKRWARGRKEERLERQLTVKATSSSEMVSAEGGGNDGEKKSSEELALAKTSSSKKNNNKNNISNQPDSIISKAHAETAMRVNQDENVQLGMLLAPHSTLTSLSRAYKLSPLTLKQLHEGLAKREPNAVVDEVHTALLRVLATDVLEADAFIGGLPLDTDDKKIIGKTSSKVIVLDDGSTIPRSSLYFDECFKYLDVVTWPAYAKKLVERLRARGNRHVPKCNWAEHRYGGYYGASMYEKIELLQFLVDETLDTNVIRNELETREVLIEAGEFQVANGGLLTSKIGALVEVYGIEHPIRGSWYSGVVIAAAGNRIRVRYDELLSDVSNHKLEEWVTLEDVRSHDWKLRRKKLTSKKLDPASVMRIAQLARKKKGGRSKRAKKKQYKSNRADDDRDAFPRVRPLNPYRLDRKSRAQWVRSAGDVVECFQGGGWWCGRITNPIGALGRMEVQFPGENESKLIKKEDIETMLTWDGEEWYIAGTDDVVEKTPAAAEALELALQAAADTHGDMCAVCGRSGSLVCCDGCPSAFHAVCAGEPTNRALSETEWFCPECVAVPEQIRSDKELRAQAFPFLRTECALCETDGDALGRKYFFSAKDGVARLEGGMNPTKYGSGRVDFNASIREDERKRFEMLAIDRKPFEEANVYLEDIRNAADAARASLKRGQREKQVGVDPVEVFEKFGLGDCGKTLPEWEKDKIVRPARVEESEEEEEDVDEMEFDDEDSEEEEMHDDEKWSDLDNDEPEAPPSSGLGGKRKRGGRREEEEEEEEIVMPTSGRSRRANAGKKKETYSPTKIAEEQRARQEAMAPKVVVKEEPISVNDPEVERALEERRKLALSHAAKIEYESSLLAVAPVETKVEKSGGDTPTTAPATPSATTMTTKTSTESCYTYQNKYANAGVFALANATGETARGRVTSLFVNQWFAPYPIPQPPVLPGWQDHIAKDKLGHVVAKACHMERYLCGLLDGPWAGTETVTGDQWRQKWLTSLRGSSTFKDVAKWILLLESSIRPLAMKAAWYLQEVKENASIFEPEKKEQQEDHVEKVGPSSLRSEVAPLALVLRGKRVPIKSLRKCARNGGVKSMLPGRVVNYRTGWRGRGMPQPSRTLRAAWIAEVENASSAAYLGLLLRFFDHHIAWDHIKSPMFHKIQSNSFDGKHKNINFREVEIVEKRFAKWPSTGAILAQYRFEPVPKDGEDGSKKTSPIKSSPTKKGEEQSPLKKEEGEKDVATPMEEDKKMDAGEEAPASQPVEEKKEVEEAPAPPETEEKKEVEEAPAPPETEEKKEVEEAPAPPETEEKKEVEEARAPSETEEKKEVEEAPAPPETEEKKEVEEAPSAPPAAVEKIDFEKTPVAEKMEIEEAKEQEAVPLAEKQPSPPKPEGADASMLGDRIQEQGDAVASAVASDVAAAPVAEAAPAEVTIHDPLNAATTTTVPTTTDEKNEAGEGEKKEEEPVPMWVNDVDCPLFLLSMYETKIRGWTRAEEKNLGFNPGFTPGRHSVTIPITYEDIGTHLAGCKVEVLWEDDEVWYRGEIVKCCEDREFGDEYAQREKIAADDDDAPDKDNEDAFTNKVEIHYETGEKEIMDIGDFKDVISKGSIRARGSIPTRGGAKKKAAKKSLNEREPKEPKEKGAGRVSLLPTLPEMERAPPGTFYATAHLELPRDVLERMVFEKTGKDYSLWQNPKVARWKLALMLDEGELRQAIADEKIKPTHVEKKKTGTYYVKKAERLAMEKQYQELAMQKREREDKGEEGQEPDENAGGDGSDLQPKTVRFVMGTKKDGSDEGAGKLGADAQDIAMEERERINEASLAAMEHLTTSPVPESRGNTFTGPIAQRCILALNVIRNVKTSQAPPAKKGLLACTHITKKLDAIEKKCKDRTLRGVPDFARRVEEVFDQASVNNTEFWEDIDLNVRPEFRKAVLLIATPKTDEKAKEKFKSELASHLEFEKGEDFGEKLVNKRVIVCWDDGEWYTAKVLKYDPIENKHTLKYKGEDETETLVLNKKPGRMAPDVPDVSFPWIFASQEMRKLIDLEEARNCLGICQYLDKCEHKGGRLIEYFYRLPEKSEMPEYYENVPNPIDLVTIISRTIGGYYKYLEDFVDDVELMLDNALNFNAPGTDANDDAKLLSRLYRQKMQRTYANYAPPPKQMPRGSEHEQDSPAKKKRDFSDNRERTKLKKLRSAAPTAEARSANSAKTPTQKPASGGHLREAMSEEELKKSGLHLKKTSWNATARCGKCRTCLNRSLKKRCMNNPKKGEE